MGTTINGIVLLQAMPKYPAPAMVAGGCERLNCAFEAVENMRPAGYC
jgi:hypothetical protein